jgi:hypothetical protein
MELPVESTPDELIELLIDPHPFTYELLTLEVRAAAATATEAGKMRSPML